MTTLTAPPAFRDEPREVYDPVIVFVVGVLMTIGVVMVVSASMTVTSGPLNWRDWWNTPLRQGVFAAAGFLAMLIAAHFDYTALAWRSRWDGWRAGLLYVLVGGLLVAMLAVGQHALGARRALVVPGVGFGFQPAEVAKLALVICLAAWLTRPREAVRRKGRGFPIAGARSAAGRAAVGYAAPADALAHGGIRNLVTGYLPAVVLGGVLCALTAIEDFGTAALMGTVMFAMLLIAGARWSHLIGTGLLGLAAGVGFVLLKPYRLQRIYTFFAETPDTANEGFQIHQAMLAIGSGGWFGRGLGAGVQKYGYLPQDNNDFILAIVCEELGIVGALVVIALFLVLIWRGWVLARTCDDAFGRLLAIGLTLLLALQAAFNVGVVTNSIPTKGISLPFVSAGGSGVVFLGIAAGLLASISRGAAAPRPQTR
jgi:cell division protein FtsW